MDMSNEHFRKVLGGRIRAAREGQGLSQDQLARMIGGVSNGAGISRIERGKVGMQLETLKRIAEALGTTMSSLLSGL